MSCLTPQLKPAKGSVLGFTDLARGLKGKNTHIFRAQKTLFSSLLVNLDALIQHFIFCLVLGSDSLALPFNKAQASS